MVTFELSLTDAWQEVLNGGTRVAFDGLAATTAYIYLSETAGNPGAAEGNPVHTWPSGWDFQAVGMTNAEQRIWVKGAGDIRGVRG
tara:strand:- start:242 stop:499 length:258 start_codon:yes stop_codon:yes gene_type:complete